MPTHHSGAAREVQALDTFIKLMRAADSLGAVLTRHAATAGLTLGQFGVLETLMHLGPMSQCDLGAKLLRSGSNVTTVVDNLEKRHLVRRVRRADDRRVVDVSLTPEGRRLIEQLFPDHAREITRLFGSLSRAEQRTLGTLCRTLGRGISQGDSTS